MKRVIMIMEIARLASTVARRLWRPSLWLTFLIPLAFVLPSCSRKQVDARQADKPTAQASSESAASTPGPKATVMAITYQWQTTANQFVTPPGMRMAPVVGEEIRYLDLANNRMRLEKYVLEGKGKRLHQTMIIDQTGSYRLDPTKNEAFLIPMTKPVPVWNFDDNINTAWAREVRLTVDPGEWLGRKCDVISLASAGKVWLWNDIPLKKEQKIVGRETIIQAYRIQENTAIDASLLQVPEGMRVRSAFGK